ncbi:uncharacterized protein LOC129750641 [Uranotaenia lowii]|uniref:uncharacterized protein LOC129750641 n=1 Tax=Uranotaenia lowii TaxID=190385 RepID=UPI00247B189E|nr:uncharacterized protein LOC129750641 [Uranotaenia lowii]
MYGLKYNNTVLLLIVLVFMPQNRAQLLLESSLDITFLAQSIASIIERFHINTYSTNQIKSLAIGARGISVHDDIINDVLRMISESILSPFHLNSSNKQHGIGFYNMLFVNNYEAFEKLLNDNDTDSFDVNGLLSIVITNPKILEESKVRRIFQDAWRIGITNIIIITSNMSQKSSLVRIYTYMPYHLNHCGEVGAISYHDIYQNSSTDHSVNLFPNRLRNFYNCSLKAGTFENKPFIILKGTDYNPVANVEGFEAKLIEIVANKLNFQINYMLPTDGYQWGSLEENNSTGLMRLIQDRKVEFGISTLALSKSRSTLLNAGIAHYTSYCTLAISQGVPYTALEKLIRPFQASVWFALILLLCATVIVIFIIQKFNWKNKLVGTNVTSPLMGLIESFFGESQRRVTTRNVPRITLLSCTAKSAAQSYSRCRES